MNLVRVNDSGFGAWMEGALPPADTATAITRRRSAGLATGGSSSPGAHFSTAFVGMSEPQKPHGNPFTGSSGHTL